MTQTTLCTTTATVPTQALATTTSPGATAPTLEQALALDNLHLAWQRVLANDGIAGVDGQALAAFSHARCPVARPGGRGASG